MQIVDIFQIVFPQLVVRFQLFLYNIHKSGYILFIRNPSTKIIIKTTKVIYFNQTNNPSTQNHLYIRWLQMGYITINIYIYFVVEVCLRVLCHSIFYSLKLNPFKPKFLYFYLGTSFSANTHALTSTYMKRYVSYNFQLIAKDEIECS